MGRILSHLDFVHTAVNTREAVLIAAGFKKPKQLSLELGVILTPPHCVKQGQRTNVTNLNVLQRSERLSVVRECARISWSHWTDCLILNLLYGWSLSPPNHKLASKI